MGSEGTAGWPYMCGTSPDSKHVNCEHDQSGTAPKRPPALSAEVRRKRRGGWHPLDWLANRRDG